MPWRYYVYVLTNTYNKILYTGMTRDLGGQVSRVKEGTAKSFIRGYDVNKLLYFEVFDNVLLVIQRADQIKSRLEGEKDQVNRWYVS